MAIASALTAWEAVRSSSGYNQTWLENKKFVDWWERLSPKNKSSKIIFAHRDSARIELQVWRYLIWLGEKWNFRQQQFLTDPALKIPLENQRNYVKWKAALDRELAALDENLAIYNKKIQELIEAKKLPKKRTLKGIEAKLGPRPVLSLSRDGKRAASYLEQVRQCPFNLNSGIGVFREWPLRAWVESQPKLWKKQRRTREMRFDEEERARKRLVLWISRKMTFQPALRQIMDQIRRDWQVAEESGIPVEGEAPITRNPRKVKTKGAIHHLVSKEFLIIGVDREGSERVVQEKIRSLSEIFPTPKQFRRHIEVLWKGFDYYRKRELSKIRWGQILGKKIYANRDREEAPGFRAARKQFAMARDFVDQKGYLAYVGEAPFLRITPPPEPSLPV